MQVPRRLRTRRDLLTLLAGAAELAVCPGCTAPGAGEQLAGGAAALYAPDGAPNPATLHEGTPVAEGVKYIVTKWFREGLWVART